MVAIYKTLILFSWRYFMVDFEVCFASLSCWNTKLLFNFNIRTSASTISWYLEEFILPSTYNISCAPSCHTTWKRNGSTSMLHSWQGVLYKGFAVFSPNIPSLVVDKNFHFGFIAQSTLIQKASGFAVFSLACFRRFILCCGCFSVFSLACFRRFILCCGCFSVFSLACFRCFILCCGCRIISGNSFEYFKYVVLFSGEQLDLYLLLFTAALLQWCVGSS